MYIGTSQLTIDAKGRFLFPAKYRDALHVRCEGALVVAHELQGCLAIYTQDYWQKKAEVYRELPEDSQAFVAHFMSTSEPIGLDSSGRLALTPELRKLIGLEAGAAVLKGVGDYFELWTQSDSENELAQLKLLAKTGKPESLRNVRIPR